MESERDGAACVLYGGPGIASELVGSSWRPANELFTADASASPSVLLVDAGLVASGLAERVHAPGGVPEHAVIVALDADADAALGRRTEISLAGVTDLAARRALFGAACCTAEARFAIAHFEDEFHEVSRIGIALLCERDRKALLRMIVAQSKRLTYSDGGGLLLMREDEQGRQWLQPVLYAFDSIGGEFLGPEPSHPVDQESIIGHAALIKKPVVIADAYELPHNARFERNVAFDIEHHYRRRSMLAVPMLDQLGRVLGILLCVNRKTDPNAKITSKEAADQYVIAYSNREVRLVRMLASQAAVAIENARLYAQIEDAFESFVQAAVTAIDLRDPATAGHSVRVAEVSARLAQDVEHTESGPYRDVRFTDAQMRALRFAALLHDIGKIAVPEKVLLKSKTLPDGGWERIDARFDLIRRTMELESCREGRTTPARDASLAARLQELERWREIVRHANEPSVLEDQVAAELATIAERTYVRPDGTTAPYLTPDELHFLRLRKGTLDDCERLEVESHVTATRDLLAHIPWPDNLRELVTYAYGHHELLNGTGYPEHLAGDEIPLQTRLLTIADIFDALTASDRPYKPAVPVERALEMLRADAAAGKLDPELVKVFTERQSYQRRSAASQPEP